MGRRTNHLRAIVSFSVSEFVHPMSNSLLSLPKACSPWRVVGKRFRSLDATPLQSFYAFDVNPQLSIVLLVTRNTSLINSVNLRKREIRA